MAVVTSRSVHAKAVEARWLRRLRDASDELMWALEDLMKVDSRSDALDELVNLSCNPRAERPPRRPQIDPVALGAARERVAVAARRWATVVVRSEQAVATALRDGSASTLERGRSAIAEWCGLPPDATLQQIDHVLEDKLVAELTEQLNEGLS